MTRSVRRATVLTGLIIAATAASMGSASAAPAADKEFCKSGGFADFINPATGQPFKNQGQCVSFVNGGGVLKPVQEEPPVPVGPTVKWGEVISFSGGDEYLVRGEFHGQPSTTYYILVQVTGRGDTATSYTTNADGITPIGINLPAGATVTLHEAPNGDYQNAGPAFATFTAPPRSPIYSGGTL